jgi:tubulin beta
LTNPFQIDTCIDTSGIIAKPGFPEQFNSDFRKFAVNIVFFPRLHFFIVDFASLISRDAHSFRTVTVLKLTQQIFDPKNIMTVSDFRNGRYLTCSAILRGKIFKEVENQIRNMQNKNQIYFVK